MKFLIFDCYYFSVVDTDNSDYFDFDFVVAVVVVQFHQNPK